MTLLGLVGSARANELVPAEVARGDCAPGAVVAVGGRPPAHLDGSPEEAVLLAPSRGGPRAAMAWQYRGQPLHVVVVDESGRALPPVDVPVDGSAYERAFIGLDPGFLLVVSVVDRSYRSRSRVLHLDAGGSLLATADLPDTAGDTVVSPRVGDVVRAWSGPGPKAEGVWSAITWRPALAVRSTPVPVGRLDTLPVVSFVERRGAVVASVGSGLLIVDDHVVHVSDPTRTDGSIPRLLHVALLGDDLAADTLTADATPTRRLGLDGRLGEVVVPPVDPRVRVFAGPMGIGREPPAGALPEVPFDAPGANHAVGWTDGGLVVAWEAADGPRVVSVRCR